MRPSSMGPPSWGPDQLERFVRYLRQPRGELRRLEDRLRSAGWTDAEVESLTLANTELGQVQELLLLTARNLRLRPVVGRNDDGSAAPVGRSSRRLVYEREQTHLFGRRTWERLTIELSEEA